MKSRLHIVISTIILVTLALPQSSLAGRIVLTNDEWTTSNAGFSNSPDAEIYVQNIANIFANGGAGQFHAYSTNFSLTGSALANAMTSAGHTWSVGTGITFDLSTLSLFDGIFLAGNTVDLDVLTGYVDAGGNVYLAGGITSNAALTANNWNPFLNQFGLDFASTISIGASNEPISSTHPIFENVTTLYQAGGQEVFDLDPTDLRNQVLEFNTAGRGLYAIYDSTVPIPPAIWLFGSGLLGLIGIARRRKAANSA